MLFLLKITLNFIDLNAANAEISATKDLIMHYGYIMGYTTDINFDSLNVAWKRKVIIILLI